MNVWPSEAKHRLKLDSLHSTTCDITVTSLWTVWLLVSIRDRLMTSLSSSLSRIITTECCCLLCVVAVVCCCLLLLFVVVYCHLLLLLFVVVWCCCVLLFVVVCCLLLFFCCLLLWATSGQQKKHQSVSSLRKKTHSNPLKDTYWSLHHQGTSEWTTCSLNVISCLRFDRLGSRILKEDFLAEDYKDKMTWNNIRFW